MEGNLPPGRTGNLLTKTPSLQTPDVITTLCTPAVLAHMPSQQELPTPKGPQAT